VDGPGNANGFEAWIKVPSKEAGIQEFLMAKVIEFYVPNNFRPQVKWAPQSQPGKVIEFRLGTEKSAESDESVWIERPWVSLL